MEGQENLRQSSEKGWSRFAASQPILTLWGVGYKAAAVILLICTFIPVANFILLGIAFFVCGIKGRDWLYHSDLYTDEQKSGINAFITRMGSLIKGLFIITMVLILLGVLMAVISPELLPETIYEYGSISIGM